MKFWHRRGRVLGTRVGAGVAALRQSQGRDAGPDGPELLLIRRRDNALWDLPGGAALPGEVLLTAALRELTEETGVTASGATLLDVFSGPAHRHTSPDGNVVDWVTAVYLTREIRGTPRAADDAAQVAWWPLGALPGAVSPATQAYFRAVAQRVGVGP